MLIAASPTARPPGASPLPSGRGRRLQTVDHFEPSNRPEPGLIPAPKAGARPYYDQAADLSAQKAYYGTLQLSSEGDQAYQQLSKLVQSTHTTELTYHPEEYVYPWVELRPNGKLASIYSPDSPIEYSPAKQRAVDAAVGKMISFPPLSPESIASGAALTFGAGTLNCEHVVPQSWYDAKEPMRGDLHHLFACDSRCNSYRGNRAYRESTGAGADQVAKCGTRTDGDQGFLPMAGHGAVARATLYFILRYPKKARSYTQDDVETLIRWHEKNPPSLYERHRNAAIQELQGNRNPFIDHPEWANQVDFHAGLRKYPVEVE